MKRTTLACIILAGIAVSCQQVTEEQTNTAMTYPETRKSDTVDVYFGKEVPDPYRWLEDDLSAETASWVQSQNDVTFGYLNNIPFRDAIRDRLKEIYNYARISAPDKHGDYYYYYRNDGLQNQSVLYRKKSLDGEEEVFIDPNKFREDGTISLAGSSFTKDGSLFGYLISEGGSDWRKAIILDTESMQQVGDTLRDIKFSGISWKGNEGFFYSSYDKPEDGSVLSGKTQFHKLFYHKMGTAQQEDYLVFGGDAQPRRYIGGYLTDDERYLIISASESTSGNQLYVLDLSTDEISEIVDDFESNYSVIGNTGSRLLVSTNFDAPNYRVVEIDVSNPDKSAWKDVIPESEHVLSASTGGGFIFASYLIDAQTAVKQYSFSGEFVRDIELPGIGSAYGFGGEPEDKTLYYTFTSFTYPSTIFEYDIASGSSELYERPEIDFNPDDYETKQVFFSSKDGTKIPMFIVYKKGTEMNGKNPAYLYSYGGFNISLRPSFSASRIVWLENGGIYAQPNIRGGGEYGEEWHLAGTKLQKQNVFDDFIAAGEYLIDNGYTDHEHLAIAGGSNGGLLVGATMTQRPDLAKVALPAVGVMDMLRYHKFTAGAGWAYDYGTSEESEEMFNYLLDYSPLHNLEDSVEYPATMVTTADHDDRVVPAHSFKFAATLQEKHTGNNPVLIRIETDAGHGAGTPITKAIEQQADIYAFTWYNMDVVPPLVKKEQ